MAYSFYSPSIQTHSAKPLFHFSNLLSSSENFCGPIVVEIVKLLKFCKWIQHFDWHDIFDQNRYKNSKLSIILIDFYPSRNTGYFRSQSNAFFETDLLRISICNFFSATLNSALRYLAVIVRIPAHFSIWWKCARCNEYNFTKVFSGFFEFSTFFFVWLMFARGFFSTFLFRSMYYLQL